MSIENIGSVLDVFAQSDRVPVTGQPRARRLMRQSRETSEFRFASSFDVESIRYRTAEGAVAHTALRRFPGLNDRLLPVPAGLHISFSGALLGGPALSLQKGQFRLTRIIDRTALHVALAAGRFDESLERRRFLALAAPNAQDFSMHITASITTAIGITYALLFAADGGILPEGRNATGFTAGLEGSVFELVPVGGASATRMSAPFAVLDRIRFSEAEESATIELAGTLSAGETPIEASVVMTLTFSAFTVSVYDAANGLALFEASSPIERTSVVLRGIDAPESGGSTGTITVLERESLSELMRFPVSGRISGLAWDGRFLLQALWPSGDLLKFDPTRPDAAPEILRGLNGGNIAGLAADGSVLVMGACKADILRSAGGTTLSFVDRTTGEERHRCERPHAVGSGICHFEGELLGSVNGTDMTPFTSDSGLVVMDKTTGRIIETIVLPRGFFVEDVAADDEGTVLVSVTEGLGRGATGSVFELHRVTGYAAPGES